MKRFVALLLILTLATLTLAGCASTDGMEFLQTESGYMLIRYTGDEDEITIPNTYNGKSVIAIGGSTFENCTSLTSVTIPESIQSIGSAAFKGCKNLTEVTLSEGLVRIDAQAFMDCSALTSIAIPDTVTAIAASAFEKCTALADISLGKGLEVLTPSAFSDCSAIASISINEENRLFRAENNTLFSGTTLVLGCKNTNLASCNVTTIGDYAFSGCVDIPTNGGTLTIPNSVKHIGNHAFARCTEVQKVVLPQGLKTLGGYAFDVCTLDN